jgi:hypothetical protein
VASASEPSRVFWALGFAASIAVHAGLVGGAALLAGRYAQASAPTEITFSDEASPAAEAVPAAAAPATSSEVATAVAADRVEPSSAASAAEKAETVQPAEAIAATEAEPVAAAQSAEAAAPSQKVEAAAAAQAAEPADASSSPDAAGVVAGEAAEAITAQEQPAAAVTTERAPAEISAGEAAAESVSPIGAQDAAPAGGDQAEQLVALQTPEAITASPVSEVQSTAATAAETAQPQPPAAGSADVGSASTAPETAQPQASGSAVAAVASGGTESVSPAAPSSKVVTGVATESLGPSAGRPEGDGGAAATIVPGGQEAAETVRPVETALLVPARPNSVLGTEIDKPTDRYRRIVDFIRGYSGGDCFIALPAMDLDGIVTFQTFGRDKAREDAFRDALGAIDGLKTEISSGDVADPQCLALAFAHAAQRYPGFSLVIDLNETEMASGTRLSGKVLNTTGRDVHLLLVDDEGTVQSMDSFLSAKEGVDRSFSVPLTLTGGPVATKQILMAIATDPPIWGLDQVKEPAADFFRELAAQVESSHADVDLAVEGFNVR